MTTPETPYRITVVCLGNICRSPIGEVVLRGDAELGFQQASEILAVKGVDLIGLLPDALQLNSLFAAGIGATTKQHDAASKLISLLRSADAARSMVENGLTPVTP